MVALRGDYYLLPCETYPEAKQGGDYAASDTSCGAACVRAIIVDVYLRARTKLFTAEGKPTPRPGLLDDDTADVVISAVITFTLSSSVIDSIRHITATGGGAALRHCTPGYFLEAPGHMRVVDTASLPFRTAVGLRTRNERLGVIPPQPVLPRKSGWMAGLWTAGARAGSWDLLAPARWMCGHSCVSSQA